MKLSVKKHKIKSGKFRFKVRDRKGSPHNYFNEIFILDFRALAQLLADLELLFNAPIDKAYKELRRDKKEDQPFW